MTPHIPEDFSTRLIDWSPFMIMGNTMPPRDPDEDEEDEDEVEEDRDDEPPIVREPELTSAARFGLVSGRPGRLPGESAEGPGTGPIAHSVAGRLNFENSLVQMAEASCRPGRVMERRSASARQVISVRVPFSLLAGTFDW